MSVPIVRGTGAINSGTGTIALAEPAGSVDGDLQLMFIETDPADAAATCTGWANTPSSPQSQDSAAATDTRLTILYRIRSGAGTLTTNDPGDHINGRILGIVAETFDRGNPFNVSAGGTDATADTSASVPGAVTTVKDCLIVVAISSGFDPGGQRCDGVLRIHERQPLLDRGADRQHSHRRQRRRHRGGHRELHWTG